MKLSAIFLAATTTTAQNQYGDYTGDNYDGAAAYDGNYDGANNYGSNEYSNYGDVEDERRGVNPPVDPPADTGATEGNHRNSYTGSSTGTGAYTGNAGNTGSAVAYNTGNTGYNAAGLKCWHCDAMSFEECEYKGEERQCLGHAETCFLEIRERRNNAGNDFMQICMGCKQKEACNNMQAQNFQNQNPDYTQCRPESNYSDSVCRQCCAEDNCTKEPSWWYPQSREEWAYTGETEAAASYGGGAATNYNGNAAPAAYGKK